jgi:hypothetical protein
MISHDLKEYSEIKGVVPIQPDCLSTSSDVPSADNTMPSTDTSISPDVTTSCTLASRPPTQVVNQPLLIHANEDGPCLAEYDVPESETYNPEKRADTTYCTPSDDTTASPQSYHTEGGMSNLFQHIAAPCRSPSIDAPPSVVAQSPNKETPPSNSFTNAQPPSTVEAGETFTSANEPQSLLLAGVLTSAPSPLAAHSAESTSPAIPARHLPELLPSVPVPESPMCEPALASRDALPVIGRKRKCLYNDVVDSRRQQDLQLISIAAKISNAILLGGRKYKSSTFKSWERDLWLLNPDRAKLTFAGLLTQQRTYTEALLSQGIVARIIHSWCLIAYEYRLSTIDRSKSTRRNQKEIRLSLRCRKLGILFLEIINKLFAQPSIGIDAYKACTAIAGECSSWYIPAFG